MTINFFSNHTAQQRSYSVHNQGVAAQEITDTFKLETSPIPLKVLLVDDEPDTLKLVRRIVQADGHEAFEALDGQQAIELFNKIQPDLVLLDIVIPIIDGLAVLEQIRRQDEICGIIMVSALTSEQLAVRSMLGGADGYISKPFKLKEIRVHIRQVMEKVRLRRQNALLQEQLVAANEKLRLYMAEPLYNRVVASPDQPVLGGDHQVVTALFMDFCGFTPLAHRLPPQELIQILNEHLALVTTAVLRHGGYVDKILGDGFMALFNAPNPLANHATMALLSAIDMMSRSHEWNTQHRYASPLRIRVGIHTGQAVVGNIGTPDLMNYTAIGDTVNLAKRLEESCADDQIRISTHTYRALNSDILAGKNIDLINLGKHIFKGWETPIEVYQVHGHPFKVY